jgi:hypothetical protein
LLRKTPIFSPKIAKNCDHNIGPWSQVHRSGMSMFESRRRRDIAKKQRLKYEKRISTLDPDHADKMHGEKRDPVKRPML